MRNTLQTSMVRDEIKKFGHATNRQIWEAVKLNSPEITQTTIHRITQRLRTEGEVGCITSYGSDAIIDCNPVPHDHFICVKCGNIKDIDVADKVLPIVKSAISGCTASGRLVITGSCKTCSNLT